MARPAFGGLAMGIHAHLYDAGRPGLSLFLCGVHKTAHTFRIGNNRSTIQKQEQKHVCPFGRLFT